MLILKGIPFINIGHICVLYYYATGCDRSDDELRQVPYLSRQQSVKLGRSGDLHVEKPIWAINKRVT